VVDYAIANYPNHPFCGHHLHIAQVYLSFMTPQEIQIAVAEEMGWTIKARTGNGLMARKACGDWIPLVHLPPYTTSIDAIREACLERFKTSPERDLFWSALKDTEGNDDKTHVWQLTALDWCEAFLATCKEIKK